MLRSLYMRNYASTERLGIGFGSGLSMTTGETGAGKSVILGAVGLSLGQRVDVKSIRQETAKYMIRARFEIAGYGMRSFFEENELEYEDEYIPRREVYAPDKSHIFISDTPASLVQMEELGEQLIDVHSQRQNLSLNGEGFQLNVLDILAYDEEELDDYQFLHREWKRVQWNLEDLIIPAEQNEVDEDYIHFQLEQLGDTQLTAGEQGELELEVDALSHTEEIKTGSFRTGQVVNSGEGGLLSALKKRLNMILGLQRAYPSVRKPVKRLESSCIELKDISRGVFGEGEEIEFDPVHLEEVSDRLNLTYTFQQRHRVTTVGKFLALADDHVAKLTDITLSDEQIEKLKARSETLYNRVKKQAAILTKLRTAATREVKKQVTAHLVPLGMSNVHFRVEIGARGESGIHDADTVSLLFSAGKNGVLQNISSVASGREITHVMLPAKTTIAGVVKLPTIIFNEIGARASDGIADRMTDIIQGMGDNDRQIISITHLPQITARGHAHYRVCKQNSETETNSRTRRLADEKRIEEITHMLGSATLADATLNNAKALLGIA